ncbi:HAD-IC family P-type ATPase [Alishewanella jeotgali]|uniref:P-type HAD superfamily ATPase n=1 Tax=Alishewanella jeotgali KCTC 22429 TaxID=1129374 RepID=H3ZB16_9ALTE|nr:HAD-IC family P-type ATPase [Alishewanella jeotgali]EHR42130.1 P-type HAD superfamily ATPase [Alishewanella jeotgali KCTC 22429]
MATGKPKTAAPVNAHSLSANQVLATLNSAEQGLTAAQAQHRAAQYGSNLLPQAAGPSLWYRFFKHFHDTLIYVLLFSAAVTALLGHWLDTAVILAVVIINAIIGFIQEGKAEQALAGIRQMLSVHANVCRDGQWQQVPAEQLVPGDVVKIRSGDRVPADLRLLDTTELRIEESALTGESQPVAKQTEPVAPDAALGDRSCLAFSGTLVTSGRGIAVVTAIGAATEIGQINQLLSEVQGITTPLTRQMNQFGRYLALVIALLALLMLAVGMLLHDYSHAEVFLAAIGFAVAAIPEGLPAILTITLALGVKQMADRKAITRRLNAVETLGAVTVICSDKTGTLTRNEMTAKEVVTVQGLYQISGVGYQPQGQLRLAQEPVNLAAHPALAALIEVIAVANDSQLVEKDGQWLVHGEPTEGALLCLAEKAGFEREQHQRLAVIPFESENKFMASLEQHRNGSRQLLVKGAPDRLLPRCSIQLNAQGQTEPLNEAFWQQQLNLLSSQGLRVLAAAGGDTEQTELGLNDLTGLCFYGLIGIIDPPRPEAISAIAACRAAGIRVKMITGDHAGTAEAIGQEMGLAADATLKVYTGQQLEQASSEQLQQMALAGDIFARTSPEHKLRLVQALQQQGEVVAMTGDGVNDAPALKQADVGVAMGIKGSEASKEAADIVLADDNFSTIAAAVAEGRTIYDNLRKAILFILPTNGAQGLVMLCAVLFGMTLPLTPVQILWVNMVVAITLALALAFEPAEPGVMQRPPRQSSAALLSAAFLRRIALVSLLIGGSAMALFQLALAQGLDLATARTVTVTALVVAQAGYLLNSRHLNNFSLKPTLLFTNRIAWLAIGILVLLQLAFVYSPLLQLWFGTQPLSLQHWLWSLGAALLVMLLVEVEKKLLW